MDRSSGVGNKQAWAVVVAAAALMALSQGSRSSFGLFVSPLNTATGLGIATISFAMAVSQLAAGLAQPVLGSLSERFGPARLIAAGGVALALTTAILPFFASAVALTLALAAGAAAGVAVGSAPTLLAAVAKRIPAGQRNLAAGIVGAGGSAGQLVLGPLTQAITLGSSWVTALLTLAALAVAAIPLALPFRERLAARPEPRSADADVEGVAPALRSPAYWYITASFFVCGFHVSFLLAHMPGVIEACGLPASLSGTWLGIIGLCNIAGSVASGAAIRHVSKKKALAVLYALRALGVAFFLAMPKTEPTVLAFSVWIGLTYMATLPPTSALIADIFGVRRLASLLGVTMLFHQVGSFLGVWLGGLAFETRGSYDWVWKADIALAVLAAGSALAIREPGVANAGADQHVLATAAPARA